MNEAFVRSEVLEVEFPHPVRAPLRRLCQTSRGFAAYCCVSQEIYNELTALI
jgi:hypothetical protein